MSEYNYGMIKGRKSSDKLLGWLIGTNLQNTIAVISRESLVALGGFYLCIREISGLIE